MSTEEGTRRYHNEMIDRLGLKVKELEQQNKQLQQENEQLNKEYDQLQNRYKNEKHAHETYYEENKKAEQRITDLTTENEKLKAVIKDNNMNELLKNKTTAKLLVEAKEQRITGLESQCERWEKIYDGCITGKNELEGNVYTLGQQVKELEQNIKNAELIIQSRDKELTHHHNLVDDIKISIGYGNTNDVAKNKPEWLHVRIAEFDAKQPKDHKYGKYFVQCPRCKNKSDKPATVLTSLLFCPYCGQSVPTPDSWKLPSLKFPQSSTATCPKCGGPMEHRIHDTYICWNCNITHNRKTGIVTDMLTNREHYRAKSVPRSTHRGGRPCPMMKNPIKSQSKPI